MLSAKELLVLNYGVGEDCWESLGLQGDPTIHPKGNQSWTFLRSSDAEAETQYFGHLMQRADSLKKTLKLGKIEGGRRRGQTEDEMVGWHHQLNGHEFVSITRIWWWTGRPSVLQSIGSEKELDMTEWLNWMKLSKVSEIPFILVLL